MPAREMTDQTVPNGSLQACIYFLMLLVDLSEGKSNMPTHTKQIHVPGVYVCSPLNPDYFQISRVDCKGRKLNLDWPNITGDYGSFLC